MIIRASHLLSGPDYRLEAGPFTLRIAGASIAAVEREDPAAAPDPERVAMAALVNAHDHGYGIRTLGVGAPDDALECWIPGLANRPETDPELEAKVAFGRMALSGIGTTVHCHNSLRRDRLPAEAEGVAKAAQAVGIRVAFSCPIADRNPIVYGDPAALSGCGYPAELLNGVEARRAGGRRQVETALALWSEHQSDCFNVQLGPIGPQWCQPETLALVAAASAEAGMRVHMHLLETERQRQWLDKEHDGRPVEWLDSIGLLSPRLTVAHGVWLRRDECDLLAERGVTVAVNSSSNLRLRSGIAPVPDFRAAGLNHGVGLDGSALDDDQDMLRELRLFKLLQSGMGLVDGSPVPAVLRAALESGFKVFNGDEGYGRLAPGSKADLMLIDASRLSRDVVDSLPLSPELIFCRAAASDVATLIVAGREVVRDGKLMGFDFPAAERELLDIARRGGAADDRPRKAEETRQISDALRRYYQDERHL